MGRARIRISPELLREWIPLPLSTEILGSQEMVGEIAIVVDDPALPDAAEGEMPEVCPTFESCWQDEMMRDFWRGFRDGWSLFWSFIDQRFAVMLGFISALTVLNIAGETIRTLASAAWVVLKGATE